MGAPLEITRMDCTGAELRGLSSRCSDGAQVRRILSLALTPPVVAPPVGPSRDAG